MTNVVEFNFESNQVRTIVDEKDNTPWFVLKDVLNAMGSSTTTSNAKASVHEVFGDGCSNDHPIVDSLGRTQNITIINEAATTFLISRSNTEAGKALNRWIHQVVLPSIRKTGGYIAGEEHFESEDELILRAMQMLERKVQAMKPKAEWFDNFVDNTTTFTTTDVAKQLGISAQALNKWMRETGIKFQNKDLPKQPYQEWFDVVTFQKGGMTGTQCRITTEGVTKITEKFMRKTA